MKILKCGCCGEAAPGKQHWKAMRVNDRDDRYLLCNDKLHALRVIAWLGLSEVTVRDATEEEEANGHADTVKA